MSKNSKQRFNGLPNSAAYAHSRSFVRRVKHLITREFFMEEFTKALNEEHFHLIVQEGSMSFVEVTQEKPPTYEELLEFYREHHNAEEEK